MNIDSIASVVTITAPLIAGIISFFVFFYKIAKMNKDEIKNEINSLKREIGELRQKNREQEEYIKKKFSDCKEQTSCSKERMVTLNNIFNPMNHSFFDRMVFLLRFNSWKKECVDLERGEIDATKGNIMYDMMMIKLSYWLRGYVELFKKSNENLDPDILQKTINKIVDQYKEEWKKAGLPKEATDLFNNMHNKRADEMFRYASIIIESVKDDSFNKIKFLDFSEIMLDEAINDIHHVMNNNKIDGAEEYISNKKYGEPFKGQSKADIFAYGYLQKEIFW